jgi:glycosyltransferase involved in cell wall biosynthesis
LTPTTRRPIRLGVIASEFFDPRVGGMGGFGWAARSLAKHLNREASGVEMVYLASDLHATADKKEDRLNGSRVVLRRASRLGNVRAVRHERLDLLLTIDYNRANTVYFRSAPRTPAIVWVRDPRTPDDVHKIQTLRIPGSESEEPQGLWCSDCSSVAVIGRESFWFKRKLMFATPAPHLAGKLEAAYGIEPSDVYLLPNPIPVNPVPVVKSARPSVIFLGRLDPIKRPWLFAALAARHSDADFLFLGQSHFKGPGSWRPENLPSNLRFLGHVGEEEKFRLLSSAWAAVNTSIHEGLAVSLLEALACETALVACQNPGFVVSRYGIYTGRFDGSGMDSLDAFSGALQALFDNPNLRRDLGGSGRAWVEATHSRDRFLESFERLCERAGVVS